MESTARVTVPSTSCAYGEDDLARALADGGACLICGRDLPGGGAAFRCTECFGRCIDPDCHRSSKAPCERGSRERSGRRGPEDSHGPLFCVCCVEGCPQARPDRKEFSLSYLEWTDAPFGGRPCFVYRYRKLSGDGHVFGHTYSPSLRTEQRVEGEDLPELQSKFADRLDRIEWLSGPMARPRAYVLECLLKGWQRHSGGSEAAKRLLDDAFSRNGLFDMRVVRASSAGGVRPSDGGRPTHVACVAGLEPRELAMNYVYRHILRRSPAGRKFFATAPLTATGPCEAVEIRVPNRGPIELWTRIHLADFFRGCDFAVERGGTSLARVSVPPARPPRRPALKAAGRRLVLSWNPPAPRPECPARWEFSIRSDPLPDAGGSSLSTRWSDCSSGPSAIHRCSLCVPFPPAEDQRVRPVLMGSPIRGRPDLLVTLWRSPDFVPRPVQHRVRVRQAGRYLLVCRGCGLNRRTDVHGAFVALQACGDCGGKKFSVAEIAWSV